MIRGVFLSVLVLWVVACSGADNPASAPTTPPTTAQGSPPGPGPTSTTPESTTALGESPSTVGTDNLPPASPIVIDLVGQIDAYEILARVTSGMLDGTSFRFDKRVHLAISHDTEIGSGFDFEVPWASGVITPDGASAGADETLILGSLFAADPEALDLIDAAAGRLSYEARESDRRGYLMSPVTDTLLKLFDSEGADRAPLRPVIEGWARLDGSPPVLLADAMYLGGDFLPTDPRELIAMIGNAREVGDPVRTELEGRPVSRVDLIVFLTDLSYVNGDIDFETLLDNLRAQGATEEETDSLRRALEGSDALVSVWVDDTDHIVRVEYELGADAIAPAIQSPSLAAALDRLDMVEHVVFTFSDFDDPDLAVDPPADFVPLPAASFF